MSKNPVTVTNTSLLAYTGITLTCDQYCDWKYRGRKNADTNEVGTWFCRGLWKHKNRFHGGCNYWRKIGHLTINKCNAECDTSGMGGKDVEMQTGRNPVTEIDSCRDGCAKGGIYDNG